MSEEKAPIEQLLVTEHNVTETLTKYYVKKKDMVNPRIIETLRHLCAVNDTKDPVRQLSIFLIRKEILENATMIYSEKGEDKLFDESLDELEAILEILKTHTIKR